MSNAEQWPGGRIFNTSSWREVYEAGQVLDISLQGSRGPLNRRGSERESGSQLLTVYAKRESRSHCCQGIVCSRSVLDFEGAVFPSRYVLEFPMYIMRFDFT